jgi:hypothetical protein
LEHVIGIGQVISMGSALLAILAALAAIAIPKLVRQPAIIADAEESGGDQIAQCEVSRHGEKLFNGPCRFRQFGGNGSFSLYPISRNNSFQGGIGSITLTVTSPGAGDVKGLVRDGTAESWGGARQEALQKACWKGQDFRLCIYAQSTVTSDGAALVFDPPSNIRTAPAAGDILCSVTSKGAIRIQGKNGEWYETDHCGVPGFIHASQVRF